MADILNNNNNNNQGPAFWLPPDFLSDEDDAADFLIPTAAPEDTFLHHSYFSSFPQKPPFNYSSPSPPHHHQIMDTTDRLFIAAAALSSTYFPCCPSKKQQLISPLPGIIGGTTGRIFKTPNGFLFPHRPSPPPKNPPPPPPLVAALYAADYNKGLPLKQNISPIKTNNRDVYCSQQKFMLQNNRQGNRVIGYGGSETTVASPPHSSAAAAWPPLSQQRLNPPPPLNDGSHQVKRKCAGTGVFLPRRYGTPLSDFQNKPDLAIPSDQVPMRKNPVLFESPFIQNLDAAAMEARNRKVQLMNPQQRLSFGTDELCLPQEWAY